MIQETMKHNESQLSEYACKSEKGIKLSEEKRRYKTNIF